MKFNITGEEFVNSLSKLSSVLPTRSTLPILDNILFELKGNTLKLMASDLEIWVRVTLEVDGEGDGTVAVDGKRLLNVARTLPSENLKIESNDKNKLTIKTKKGKYTLPGEAADEFPAPEERDDFSKIELDGSVLRRFIGKVIHAVNNDDLRRNMAGILFDIKSDELRLVATDGFRLGKIIKSDFKHQGIPQTHMIVPTKTCQLYLRLNSNNDSTMEFDNNILKMSFDGTEIFSKLIDDTFPNYESVIPKENDKVLKVQKSDIQSSLKRAEIVADVITKRVKLEIKDKTMTIKADNPEIGSEGEETIDIEFIENDAGNEDFSKNPFVIAFNAGYLLDCVSQIETDEILLSFSSPSKATIANPSAQEENENFMELVMPVRIG
ncbi:MAG TPA: DNA polymerase III subunit beta [Ignavibacteria bacterium]|nr:DNA polymerase III subunit beta [Ignavibacteria bacterium]